MKQTYLCALVFVALICTACIQKNNTEPAPKTDGKLAVAVTIFPLYDFTRTVAGDAAKITMLIPPGADMHSYTPPPHDIDTIQNSDIFLYIGGISDGWADEVITAVHTARQNVKGGARRLKTVRLIESVDALREGEGGIEDEHIWTTPSNALLMLHAITAALCEMDNGNVKTYVHNAAAYIDRLTELNTVFRGIVNEAPQKTVVFAGSFPFRYFTGRYGLSYHAAFPVCPALAAPAANAALNAANGTRDAAAAVLINTIKTEKIPVIFYTESSGEQQADALHAATGAQKLLFHAAETVSQKEFAAGITYLDIMYKNAEHLKQALQLKESL